MSLTYKKPDKVAAEMEEQMKALQHEVQQQKWASENYGKERKQLKRKVESLEKEIEDSGAAQDELQQTNKKLEAEIGRLRTKLDEFQEDIADDVAEPDSLKQKIKRQRQTISDIQTELSLARKPRDVPTDEDVGRKMEMLYIDIQNWARKVVNESGTGLSFKMTTATSWLGKRMPSCKKNPDAWTRINAVVCLFGTALCMEFSTMGPFGGGRFKPTAPIAETFKDLFNGLNGESRQEWIFRTSELLKKTSKSVLADLGEYKIERLQKKVEKSLEAAKNWKVPRDFDQDLKQLVRQAADVFEEIEFHSARYCFVAVAEDYDCREGQKEYNPNLHEDIGVANLDDPNGLHLESFIFPGLRKLYNEDGTKVGNVLLVWKSKVHAVINEPQQSDVPRGMPPTKIDLEGPKVRDVVEDKTSKTARSGLPKGASDDDYNDDGEDEPE